MPYTDETGKILIDEIEAASDIEKLNQAREKLTSALEKIQQVMTLNTDFDGPVKESVEEATVNFSSALQAQIEAIDSSIRNINHVVNHYMTIDQNLKNTINTYLT